MVQSGSARSRQYASPLKPAQANSRVGDAAMLSMFEACAGSKIAPNFDQLPDCRLRIHAPEPPVAASRLSPRRHRSVIQSWELRKPPTSPWLKPCQLAPRSVLTK